MVSEQFRVDWATVLVSTFSTIVIRFDGHGSGFQGTKLLHEVRRNLGKLEERDQLEALRWAGLPLLKVWAGGGGLHCGSIPQTPEVSPVFSRFIGSYLKSLILTRAGWEFMER